MSHAPASPASPLASDEPRCGICHETPVFRRHVCRTCHRKLGEAGVPLPPAHRGPQPWSRDAWLESWARTLERDAVDRLRAALDRASVGQAA